MNRKSYSVKKLITLASRVSASANKMKAMPRKMHALFNRVRASASKSSR